MTEYRNADGLTEEEFLAQYKPGNYQRPSVTVDTIVLGMNNQYDSLKLLLIKRKNHPYINRWAFPGGFVDMQESAFEGACRELEEETGLTDVYLEQLYTYTDPGRDPRMRVIDIAYLALIPLIPAKAGDDAAEAAWFDVVMNDSELVLSSQEHQITIKYALTKKKYTHGVVAVEGFEPPTLVTEEGLAFDHPQILVDSILRLRNKVEYTDIAFNLMPEKFTLTDLQQVYEILLGRSLYKKNFRTKIIDKVTATEETAVPIISKGTKPAVLYNYKGE